MECLFAAKKIPTVLTGLKGNIYCWQVHCKAKLPGYVHARSLFLRWLC